MQYELIKILHRSSQEIGKLKRNNPEDIRSLEWMIWNDYKRKYENYKKHERQMKSSRR